jgi:hypothetical protein
MIPRLLLTTPRPVPSRRFPAAASSLVVLLALPVFAAAGWRLGAWGLGAALWFAGEAFAFAISRLPLSLGNLVSSGFVGFAMTFRVIVVMIVLIAVAASDKSLAFPAGLLFIAAYSLELALSLLLYFGGEKA